jgi:hypothetical protein
MGFWKDRDIEIQNAAADLAHKYAGAVVSEMIVDEAMRAGAKIVADAMERRQVEDAREYGT